MHSLTLFSLLNATYTFWRKRHYRLFENPVDTIPSTPSAHRVRVDSSPVASSPLVFLSKILGTESAESRAHPDPSRDVWEVAIWDPLPVSLKLFCYFSPGHVLVYWIFLPTISADPRPSTTVATAILVSILLSIQLSILQSFYSQQSKDSTFISKEVLHEYDTKYVRPRTQNLYRDVSTQFSEQASYSTHRDSHYNTVRTFTPMVVINRGFQTNPNPNYSKHTVTDGDLDQPNGVRQRLTTPSFQTPSHGNGLFSPAKTSTSIRPPVFRPPQATSDGGSLGVYSHAASPLRKSASTNFPPSKEYHDEHAYKRAGLSPGKRPTSPEKRMSVPLGGVKGLGSAQRLDHIKSDTRRRESGRF